MKDNNTPLELEHERILSKLAVMCRSNKHTFTVDDRIKVIREELKDTEFNEISPNDSIFSMWAQDELEYLPENIVLISSHVDVVPGITECSSILREDGLYSGTYDNLSTNAAMTILMKEFFIPENVVFAFTGDEETGRCNGAKSAVEYLLSAGKKVTCIALDVTYEGFYENRLYSIENCTAPKIYEERFLNKVALTAINSEKEQSFCFVKAGPKHIPTKLDDKYLTLTTGMYDEAFAYRDMGCPALSFCLPCNGSMHSNSGVYIKQPVFEGYIISLANFIYEFTKSYPELVTIFKNEKSELLNRAKKIELPRLRFTYFPESFYNLSEYQYENENSNDWYIDDFSPIMNELYSLAIGYNPEEVESFIKNTIIPDEYLESFQFDKNGKLLPEEKERIDNFLRGLFEDVHNNFDYEAEESESLEEDDFYLSWCNKLAQERINWMNENDTEYSGLC